MEVTICHYISKIKGMNGVYLLLLVDYQLSSANQLLPLRCHIHKTRCCCFLILNRRHQPLSKLCKADVYYLQIWRVTLPHVKISHIHSFKRATKLPQFTSPFYLFNLDIMLPFNIFSMWKYYHRLIYLFPILECNRIMGNT